MKRQNFYNKINKLEAEYEQAYYDSLKNPKNQSELQALLNWRTYFTKVLDTTRVFFFEKSNSVVLIDSYLGYRERFRTPSAALQTIRQWQFDLINNLDKEDF